MTIDSMPRAELSATKRRLLEQRLRGLAARRTPDQIPVRSTTDRAVLAPVQRGVWLANQLLANNAVYGVHWAMWLGGHVDRHALSQAFDALVRRHEVLRTTYEETDEGPVQVVHPPAPAAVRYVTAPDRTRALEIAEESTRQHFDLVRGPLFTGLVVSVGEREHLLLVRAHHLLVDEWSGDLLARELGELYQDLAAGRDASRPEPPIQYADFAQWQAGRVAGEVGRDQIAYWREALSGTPSVLELPTDRPRPEVPSYRGGSARRALPAPLSEATRELAGRHRVTLFTALLAAFAGVLHRYSGQSRLAVGSLLAGRTAAQTESLLGVFANTVAIPVDLSGDPSFAGLLGRANASVLAAMEHQDVAFDQVVAELGVEREAGRTPLFQVIFQAVEADGPAWSMGDLRVEPASLGDAYAKVDLTLFAVTGQDGIELALTYAEDLFQPATARRLLDHVAAFLAAVVADPDARVSEVDYLTAAERERALVEWAGPAMPFPAEATVHGLVAECAARDAGRVAIRRTDGTTMSFGELDTRANQLAHHLRGLCVGRESLVGVCVPHSTDLFVALLGILKSGAAYVPLDGALPAQRLEWILTDTAAPVVVTTAAAAARIPAGYSGELVLVDEEWARIGERPGDAPAPVSDADNLLYVMYTSGSTGRPKGVLVPHRGVVNYLWWAVTGYGLEGERGAPMLGSVAFDLSVPNFWLPLIGGRCVSLLPEDRSLDTLARRLREPVDYSLLKITPGHLDVLRGMLDAGSVSSVRTFVVGADEVRPETVAGWRAVAPAARVLNEYGPTETVVGCSVYEVPEDFDPAAAVPIGRPIGNLRMYVLDRGMHPVPVGVVGELYIGGAGVARGYLHRPALTAERFVPDPFGAAGDRLYRTGDLARYRADGNFEFLGRTDFQVKVRGYRVELGEVEARLGHHPAVAEAVATTATVAGHKRLVGYVVPVDAGAPPSTALLREFMAETLPEYMVPTLFVTLPAMPLTAAGKVDRTALPAPRATVDTHPIEDTPGPAAATPTERELAGIWRDVLGVAEVGRRDNFFDLGGDSILAIKAVSRARRAGYALSAVSMFTHQTVAELAAAIGPSTAAVEPERPADGGLGRLSPLQAAMVLQNVADPRAGDYIEQFLFSFEGDLDPAALRRAWQFAIDRHAALRTSFHWRDLPYPIYVRHDAVTAPVGVDDWRDDAPARLAALVESVRRQGFPAAQPPQRLHLVRTGERQWTMLWAFHHVLLDGWSIGIVLDDVFAAYRAFVAGRPAPALPPPVPYDRHNAWLAGRDPGAASAFWRTALSGLTGPTPVSVLDPDAAADQDGARPVRVERFTLSVAQAEKLREFSRRHRITLRVLLQAAWGLLLARDSRRDDVLFGTTVAGRSTGVPDVERLVGMLMNTVPTRVRLDRGESVPKWLARFAAEQVSLREYEHTALAEVRRESAFPADQPLFHSVFLFDNFADDSPELPDLRLTGVEHDHGRTGYPLVLDIADRDRLGVTLLADPGRVRPGGAGWLLSAYRKLLLELVAPGARVADLLPEPVAPAPDWQDATVVRTAGSGAALAPHVSPRTETERVLAGIWSDVLGKGPVGAHDHFLLLGGDSIRAMQVVARALDAGLALRPHHLLAHPTLAELAAFADRDEERPAVAEPSGVDSDLVASLRARYGVDAVTEAYPLTPMQTGMLFHSLGGGTQYVQVFAYEIDADLDPALFERAWHLVARRHPALRTSFRWLGLDRPVQVVQAEPAVPLTVLDWRDEPGSRRGALLRELLAAELGTPFDLAAGPPLWLTLVRAGERDWKLVWRTHHMLLDGWSGPAVLAEAWAVYEALRATGVPPELPAPVPVGVYLAWLAQQDPRADAAHWRDALGGFAVATPLPAAGPDGETAADAGAGRLVARVPADVVDGLHDAARRWRVTAGVLLHAMWALVLARHSGRDDVVFGTAVSGRSAPVPGVARMVGMLMNTLPVRVPVSESTPVGDWLAGLHRQLTGVRAHEHCALTEAQRQSAVPGDRPLFETILVFDNERYGGDLPAPLRRMSTPDAVRTGYPLVLDALLTDGLTLQLNYERARYGAAAAARLVADAVDVLRALVAAGLDGTTPAALLSRLPALPTPVAAPAASGDRAPAAPGGQAFAAPRSPREQTLAEIWAEVLGVSRVGIHDNFFELGGDSIIAIQVVARARRAGLPIGPKQLLDHPTVARLCAVAARQEASPVPIRADQGLVTGPVPLTPIQRWFTELEWPHDHYNQVSLLRVAEPLDPDLLETALRAIVAHHDALRLRLTRSDGRWRQHIAPDAGGALLRRVDLSGLTQERETAAMACAATAAHTSLDLAHGPLLRAVLFQGARRGGAAPPTGCWWSCTTSRWTPFPGASCWRTWRPPTGSSPPAPPWTCRPRPPPSSTGRTGSPSTRPASGSPTRPPSGAAPPCRSRRCRRTGTGRTPRAPPTWSAGRYRRTCRPACFRAARCGSRTRC